MECNIYTGPLLIQKANATVKHISTANIWELVYAMKNVAIATKYVFVYGIRLAYLHLNVTHSKGHSQGHAHLDCEYH